MSLLVPHFLPAGSVRSGPAMPGPGGDEGTSLASNSLLNLPALTASGSFSSSCSLSSKTRARKARKISEREWERLKPKILESRATRTVPEVAIDMRTRFGFKATYVHLLLSFI